MNLTWWCSAQTGVSWSWSPQAYPGIWIFLLAVAGAYAFALLRIGPTRVAADQPVVARAQLVWFGLGWGLLWLVLDWPLGALAAGYLLTAHMTQYVLISLVIVPMLENGLPDWMHRALLEARGMGPLRWFARRPVAAFALFNGVMVLTHLPVVADTLKPLQLGSMAIDLLWILAAVVFWWSVRGTGEGAPDRVYGKRMLYVSGIKILPIFLGAFFVFADFPLYRTYELATRVLALTAREDQTLAGWLVWMGTTPILLFRLGSAFFAWYEIEARRAGRA